MSLAAEVGDPSLVYKFMSLARHNSLWSSRAAFGRFGLGSILSSSDVLKHNPKLYPKLYRYRFDPNPNVAKSMEDIWKSLIGGEEREVLETWFETILEDLLEQALGREWRTRESCCNAIGELVQGRGVEKVCISILNLTLVVHDYGSWGFCSPLENAEWDRPKRG